MTSTPATNKWAYSSAVSDAKPPRRYWIAQSIVWPSWFIIWLAFYYSNGGKSEWREIAVGIIMTVTSFGLAHLYRGLIHNHGWLSLGLGPLAVRVVASSFVMAILVQVIDNPLFVYVLHVENWDSALDPKFIVTWQVNGFMTFYFWSVFHIAFAYLRVFKASQVDRWRLESALQAAELRALKSQVNPHFLFNCLNNLRSLVAEDPGRAREMMLRLSELLRYALDISNHERVLLSTEMEIVQAYLQLESLQFEERLSWQIDIQPEAQSASLPPLMLQHLVENAIKHGIAKAPHGGRIRIEAKLRQGNLVLDVENTGQMAEASSNGTGLSNARERLRLLSGELARLTLAPRGPQHVAATAVIPLT